LEAQSDRAKIARWVGRA